MQANLQPADFVATNVEPTKPILESIETELHIYYEEYCSSGY